MKSRHIPLSFKSSKVANALKGERHDMYALHEPCAFLTADGKSKTHRELLAFYYRDRV